MPELPEVECVRAGLERIMLGRRIVDATLRRRDVLTLPGDPRGGWSRQPPGQAPSPITKRQAATHLLADARVREIRRHGKQAAIISGDGRAIVVQLGMSGRVLESGTEPATKHAHASWALDDGRRIDFIDPRRFGGLVALASESELDEHWSVLGPDALLSTPASLRRAMRDRAGRRSAKAMLLDQNTVAGFGNIYADESLFAAGISPLREANGLSDEELATLVRQGRSILRRAVAAGGSTLRDYVRTDGTGGEASRIHKVYGRGNEPCTACGRPLRTESVAQRTTVWCTTCQAS